MRGRALCFQALLLVLVEGGDTIPSMGDESGRKKRLNKAEKRIANKKLRLSAQASRPIRHGKLTDTAAWGTSPRLDPPRFCYALEDTEAPPTAMSFTRRIGTSFYNFMLGEIFPMAEFLATHAASLGHSGPLYSAQGDPVDKGKNPLCFPRRVTVFGRPGAYDRDYSGLYREILSQLDIQLDLRRMSGQSAVRRGMKAEQWHYGTLILDSSFFHTLPQVCEPCAASCPRQMPTSLVEVSNCSLALPSMFNFERTRGPSGHNTDAHRHCPRTCTGMFSESAGSTQRCVAASRNHAGRKDFRDRFGFVRKWLLKWAGVGEMDPGYRRQRPEGLVAMVQLRSVQRKTFTGELTPNYIDMHLLPARLKTTFGSAFREVRLASNDGLSLQEQINAHHDVDVFIFGHGADMIHMTWMPPGGLVIEIGNQLQSPHHGAAMLSYASALEHHTGFLRADTPEEIEFDAVLATVRAWLSRRDGKSSSCSK